MYSGLIYATSLPAAVDALKIPLLKRFQSCEVDETDGEVSRNERDEDTSSSKPGKPQASLTVTEHHYINCHPTQLPLSTLSAPHCEIQCTQPNMPKSFDTSDMIIGGSDVLTVCHHDYY
jgi:hypothetical protein